MASQVEKLIGLPLACLPFNDPERDLPASVLEDVQVLANGGDFRTTRHFVHPVQQALHDLVSKGDQFEKEVSLGDIKGIVATKGGADSMRGKLHMSLDRLPETMCLAKGETYGPLCPGELDRLRTAVHEELPSHGGKLRLAFYSWDRTYVVVNAGASRRFALLRRLSPKERLPAQVTPLKLSQEALHLLRERWRVVVLAPCESLTEITERLRELSKHLFWSHSRIIDGQHSFLLVIPYLQHVGPRVVGPLGRLHNMLDDIGAFDLGRYLTEQISVGQQRLVMDRGAEP